MSKHEKKEIYGLNISYEMVEKLKKLLSISETPTYDALEAFYNVEHVLPEDHPFKGISHVYNSNLVDLLKELEYANKEEGGEK